MNNKFEKYESLLGELKLQFQGNFSSKVEYQKKWSALAFILESDVENAHKLGLRILESLETQDDFFEEVLILIGKTIYLAEYEELAYDLCSKALVHPNFRNKERIFVWVDGMRSPEVVVSYLYVLDSFLSGKEYFSEKMAEMSLVGLAFHRVANAANVAVRFLDDEETETYSAAIDYLVKTTQVSVARELARAIHQGGTKEDIIKVLEAIRDWKSIETLPELEEMLKLDWVNLERTRPIKSELQRTISELKVYC